MICVSKYGIMTEDALLPDDPVGLLGADGTQLAHPDYELPGPTELVHAYEALVRARRLNEQAYALVRQGRLAVYPSSHGQEACQVGAALALSDGDWLFPTYRDTAAVVARGVDPLEALTLFKGDWHTGFNPYDHQVAPQATPLATQLLHAAGLAHAAQLRGHDTVALAMCGDGATSEGDFHEALNFAAVFNTPVVFFIQNNEYAISVPLARQTAAPSLAHKAIGYGMPGRRVDGNDVAAVLAVLGEAVTRARSGHGPTLVEAHTYRMHPHTNADDQTRYRDAADVREWEPKDPLLRLQAYLRSRGLLEEADQQRFEAGAEEMAARMREAAHVDARPDPQGLFDFVFTEPTQQLRAQKALLADELDREEALT